MLQVGGGFLRRITCLGRYQKAVLLFMTVMVLVFTVIYPATLNREGFLYQDAILIPGQEDSETVYSGKIQGETAVFTVYEDRTVAFQYGDKRYGPYTARKDPAAAPKDGENSGSLTGIEILDGEEIFFRGGVEKYGDQFFLYKENGQLADMVFLTTNDGVIMEENGVVIDPMEPPVSVLLNLMDGPELTHKGDEAAWFGGVLICVMTAISILFADELFRWNLSFQIRNSDRAEPSDWEIAGRYFAWTVLPLAALLVFIAGLQ